MKKESYSIDDLHLAALTEFDGDEDAQKALHASYASSQANYIASLQLLRASKAAEC